MNRWLAFSIVNLSITCIFNSKLIDNLHVQAQILFVIENLSMNL